MGTKFVTGEGVENLKNRVTYLINGLYKTASTKLEYELKCTSLASFKLMYIPFLKLKKIMMLEHPCEF